MDTARSGAPRTGGTPIPLVDLDPVNGAAAPAAVETHLSVVLLAGTRAYKFYKPVTFGFIDASTVERRRELCELEVAQNRRFSPDAYLGVVALRDEAGQVHDHAVVMERLPADRRLSTLLAGAEAEDALRAVAHRLATVHAESPRPTDQASEGTVDDVRSVWDDLLAGLRERTGTVDSATIDRIATLGERYLSGRAPLFEHRAKLGHVVDGHGDLLADDVYVLDGGVRLLDCLAFSERLRRGDVLADVAFLAMDVERLAGPTLARQLVEWYDEFSGENHPGTLAHHYVAQRAVVRAVVALLRAGQGNADAVGVARDLLGLALDHLERSRVRLVLVGGPPGTGKTTVSEELAGAIGWTVLHSDDVRVELFGEAMDTEENPIGEGRYGEPEVDRVYEVMLERAALLNGLGESVVLDASFGATRHRERARACAAATATELIEFRCDAPLEVACERITARRRRGDSTSEATLEVARALFARAAGEPWPEAFTIDTTHELDLSVRSAVHRAR
ncbi:MAG: hypothetical protein FJW83_08995 [Actinobacteria bacterium]|nr:hypothetical protein [Actinomycetota bacterium]